MDKPLTFSDIPEPIGSRPVHLKHFSFVCSVCEARWKKRQASIPEQWDDSVCACPNCQWMNQAIAYSTHKYTITYSGEI